MVLDRTRIGQQDSPSDDIDEKPPPRYFIDGELAKAQNRSLSLLIANRRCYTCQQADDERPQAASDPQLYLERIADHCGETADYLSPDTPIKEAIFRVFLTRGDEPLNAQEISEVLSEKWALSSYPRHVSPSVIQRLLDSSESYCISRVPEPEAEQDSDSAEEVS